jgi:hypothetical protein
MKRKNFFRKKENLPQQPSAAPPAAQITFFFSENKKMPGPFVSTLLLKLLLCIQRV